MLVEAKELYVDYLEFCAVVAGGALGTVYWKCTAGELQLRYLEHLHAALVLLQDTVKR
jgi:hypothetical protein